MEKINDPVDFNQPQQSSANNSDGSGGRNRKQRFNSKNRTVLLKNGMNKGNPPSEAGISPASSNHSSQASTLLADNGDSEALTKADPASSAPDPSPNGQKKKHSQKKQNSYKGESRFQRPSKNNRNNSIDPELVSSTTNKIVVSKKTNLNNLLNFTYESARESNDNYYEYERFTKQFWSMKLSKNSYFSKEQYLQAK